MKNQDAIKTILDYYHCEQDSLLDCKSSEDEEGIIRTEGAIYAIKHILFNVYGYKPSK